MESKQGLSMRGAVVATGRISSSQPNMTTSAPSMSAPSNEVTLKRRFSAEFKDPFDSVAWETRTAEIKNPTTGEIVFREEDLEFPTSWSQNATALVAEKYFRTIPRVNGTTTFVKEKSVKDMVSRVADTITSWGEQLGYFMMTGTSETFSAELRYILVNQMASFNSPVWFNVGTNQGKMRTEQCSACFINSLEDTMESILDLGVTEGKLYKGGSGSGVNYSNLRSSKETLSKGGTSSGPVPFIAKDDLNAGAIKSGGGTRRAAKMAMLDIDHGDVLEFITCKSHAEKAAQALVAAGFDNDFRARWGAYQMVPFQNANHSVRVSDAFMNAVDRGADWDLLARNGEVLETLPAKKVWDTICEAAWECGDPGLQFDSTINDWHTTPKEGRINASNPCSEYMFLDDTACNLASINLMKFQKNGEFLLDDFLHTVDVLITAMDIIVDGAGYPTQTMQDNSEKYRTLGLGYTNLGALIMSQGLAYDSSEGRDQASVIASLMTARAYARSAELAEVKGTFTGYDKQDMGDVILKHAEVASRPKHPGADTAWWDIAKDQWGRCIRLGSEHGYRNAQATVLAPTGTISFMMDCDTTGIEPELSLVKTKKLVGGGTITICNQRVVDAMQSLGYSLAEIGATKEWVTEQGSVVGSPVKEEHYPVFDSSFPDPIRGRSLRPEAHILMMAAVQPFISGAISKTCNVSNDATVKDVSELYKLAWKTGLKAVALYRDGCKSTQPLSAKNSEKVVDTPVAQPTRRKLDEDCDARRHKFRIGQHEGYIHVGLYRDGTPGEVFIKMSKEGSTVSGLMDTVGILTSMSLQYGVSVATMAEKFGYTSFEPSGFSGNQDIGFARSPVDYLFRWLGSEFGGNLVAKSEQPGAPIRTSETKLTPQHTGTICPACGNVTKRAGSCSACDTCGWTEGCG